MSFILLRRFAGKNRFRTLRSLSFSFVVALIVSLFSPLELLAQGPQAAGADLSIDERARQEIIEGVIKQLNDYYVFPDVAKKMEQSLRERMQKKEYDQVTSARQLASTLTDHLQAVSRDKHLRVFYSAQPIRRPGERQEPTPEERERYEASVRRMNAGFEKIERLAGNVGYLDLRGFVDARMGAETATAAMNLLANADALIVDLRRNGGGDPAMVALITSYLFGAEPVHLNDLYWREGNTTHQWWTLPYVPGRRFGDKKPVYVLTSKRTFSAAEEFTYNLKNLKRATIVGETTGGGAHPGGMRKVHDHFGMFVPSGRAINPISKTNWEGTGVTPDVDVPADHALKVAHLDALKRLIETASDEQWKNNLKQAMSNVQKELDELKNGKTDSAASSSPQPTSSVTLPDTPAGRRLAAWLAAFNQGDVNAMKRFHSENAAKGVLDRNKPEDIAGMDMEMFGETGGLNLRSVVRSAANEIEILAQSKKNSEWIRVRIGVEPSPPHAISMMTVEPGTAPSNK
jgi:hypothetical protein